MTPISLLIPTLIWQRPNADPGPQLAAVERLLWRCQEWWGNAGVRVLHAGWHVLLNEHPDLTPDNPWSNVLPILQRNYPPDALYLVIAPEWDGQQYIGWGGPPMALVGKYVWDRIASIGTPEAVWDDEQAGFILMHETGHALGLPHDFVTPGAIMGYQYERGFDAVLSHAPDGTDNSGGIVACSIARSSL